MRGGASLLMVVLAALAFRPAGCKDYKLGLLIPYNNVDAIIKNSFFNGKNYAAAMTIAVNDVNASPDLLPNDSISFDWKDTDCKEFTTVRHQIEMIKKDFTAFIGPGCYCRLPAKNAAAFNKTMISYMCTSPELTNKTEYPTFARTFAVDTKVTPTVIAVLHRFKWDQVAIIYERLDKYYHLSKFMEKELLKQDIKVNYIAAVQDHTQYSASRHANVSKFEKEYEQVMENIKTKARIVIMVTSYEMAVEGQYVAKLKGLYNGKYVFLMFEMSPMVSRNYDQVPFKWFYNRARNNKADMRAGLVVTVNSFKGVRYDNFTRNLRLWTSRPPFNSTVYINSTLLVTEPPIVAASLYDAVHIFAIALNKTLAAGENVDGQVILNKLKNFTYTSIRGYQVHLDSNADAEFNMTLRNYRKIANHTGWGADTMQEIASFAPSQQGNDRLELRFLPRHHIEWFGGAHPWPPPAMPKCGFLGELCKKDPEVVDETTTIITTISVTLGLLAVLLIVIIFRHYIVERELHSRLWKIEYSDLHFGHCGRRNPEGSLASSVMRLNDDPEMLPLVDFQIEGEKSTTVAHFKGNLVTVAALPKRSVDVSRQLLLEMKQMRDIRHDNLNQFIGACVGPPNVCIIMHYCSRGSLQDILENDDVNLDLVFIASLLSDIVKGMEYLHNSDIKSHGNLKSSNCLVDSRWVLKITDYGLPTLRSRSKKSTIVTNWRDLLWVAPEILRIPSRPPKGTQKGDVYSFAIVLQEFHTREGPYSANYMEPKAIIDRVRMSEFPPFRPIVAYLIDGAEELRDLMKQCWNEEPEMRPDFSDVKKTVHRIVVKSGMKRNIFDNMVNMMEKYADNLEHLVAERTDQLVEEKRKTEALLESILPRPVAEQLKKGKAVEAESFDEVSIYFSDIVGFTSLSAASSPMQVVTFLNDLYTLFDDIIQGYDVYKVETIGDAYMVVSGLPIRNGRRHAGEICKMALHLVDAVSRNFVVRHKPEYKLQLRVGIHSGPVVAGVVGITMARYCLFGDTVNTASRMESNGEPLRIHISQQTKDVLDELGGFVMESRGMVKLKGKGEVESYWLVSSVQKNESWQNCVRALPTIEPAPLIKIFGTPSSSPQFPRIGSLKRGARTRTHSGKSNGQNQC